MLGISTESMPCTTPLVAVLSHEPITASLTRGRPLRSRERKRNPPLRVAICWWRHHGLSKMPPQHRLPAQRATSPNNKRAQTSLSDQKRDKQQPLQPDNNTSPYNQTTKTCPYNHITKTRAYNQITKTCPYNQITKTCAYNQITKTNLNENESVAVRDAQNAKNALILAFSNQGRVLLFVHQSSLLCVKESCELVSQVMYYG